MPEVNTPVDPVVVDPPAPPAEPAQTGADQNYIEIIKRMRETMVSREEHDRVLADNRSLVEALVEGRQIDLGEDVSEPVDVSALRKDLFSEESDLSNLDYAERMLALRSALMENGEPDPFLPIGQVEITQHEIDTAQKVADALQSCVDYAQGDSSIFTSELMRITREDAMLRARNNSKTGRR